MVDKYTKRRKFPSRINNSWGFECVNQVLNIFAHLAIKFLLSRCGLCALTNNFVAFIILLPAAHAISSLRLCASAAELAWRHRHFAAVKLAPVRVASLTAQAIATIIITWSVEHAMKGHDVVVNTISCESVAIFILQIVSLN